MGDHRADQTSAEGVMRGALALLAMVAAALLVFAVLAA